MNGMDGGKPRGDKALLGRRGLLLAPLALTPLALTGCETIEGWFTAKKDILPGKREPLREIRRGFNPDESAPRVTVPAPVRNAAWPQAGGNAAHLMGHLNAAETLTRAWSADLGEGGGYRRKILAQPVVADGVVFAMDSDSMVSAYNLGTGARLWRTVTVDRDLDSSNVGGGLCWDAGTVYAVNGMSELLALDAARGTVKWRHNLRVNARSAPTVAEGRIFLTTIDSRLLALSVENGRQLWAYQSTASATTVLGGPAPAHAQGMVVAGFGSGEIAALRGETGAVVWNDGLGIVRGRSSLVDFLAIVGAPVISNGQVFATGMGGITLAVDLPTGRRIWERRAASASTPWVAGNWMYLISVDQELGAINTEDSRIAWVSALPRWENPEKKKRLITWYGPVLAGNRLIVVGSNSEALSISPLTGEILGKQTLSDAPAPFAPVVADGTVLTVTDDARLTAWR